MMTNTSLHSSACLLYRLYSRLTTQYLQPFQWEEPAYADPFTKTNSLVLDASGEVRLRSVARDGARNELAIGESKFSVTSDDFSVFNIGEELLLRVTNDTLYVKQATVHGEPAFRFLLVPYPECEPAPVAPGPPEPNRDLHAEGI